MFIPLDGGFMRLMVAALNNRTAEGSDTGLWTVVTVRDGGLARVDMFTPGLLTRCGAVAPPAAKYEIKWIKVQIFV